MLTALWNAGEVILLVVILVVAWRFFSKNAAHNLVRVFKSLRECFERKRRAEALLRGLLTEDEYRQLTWRGYLEVPSPTSPKRVYHVPKYRGQVHVYEEGKRVMVLCVQPTEPVPDADVVVMHKLMIEGNELEYLKVANRLEPSSYRHFI